MQIALDALQVRAAKSGVGQYIQALTEAMVPLAPVDEFTIYCTRENVANYALPQGNLHPRIWGLPQRARTLRLLYQAVMLPFELQKHRYHVFHGMSNFLPVRKVCPFVVTIHDLSYYVNPQRCPPVRRRYWYTMTSRTIALADVILADSENTRRDIARFFPDAERKTRVVYIAAHARFRPLNIEREQSNMVRSLQLTQPYLLYVGTLEPGKNVERTIRAFDAIASDFPEHQLILAGDRGWLYESIFATAKSARASRRIRFLGHVPDEQIVELFNFCDAFVYPSLYEGFGLPPLEAMACGAPVITSNNSSIPEVVGDAAIQVDAFSVEQLSAAMRLVLSDSAVAQDLRERGLQRAKSFTWQESAHKVLSVYRELG